MPSPGTTPYLMALKADLYFLFNPAYASVCVMSVRVFILASTANANHLRD